MGPSGKNLAWKEFRDKSSLNNEGQHGGYKLKEFSILQLEFKVDNQMWSYASLDKFARKILR